MLAFFLQLLCLVVGFASAAPANSPYRIEVADLTVAPGGTGTLRVIFAVPEGFHTYRDWVDVAVTDPGGLTIGAPSYPPGLMKDDPGTPGTQRETYESDVYVDLSVTAPAAPGKHTVALHARYQGCKKALCYMPFEDDYTAVVTVAGPTGAVASPNAPPAAVPGVETAVLLAGKAGAPNEVRVAVDLQGDWHINKAFVSLTLVDAAGYTLGDIVLPAGEKSGEAGNEREDYVHDLDLVVPISGPPGPATVKVDVAYQACKGVSLCMMPTSLVVDVPVVIDPSFSKGASASTSASVGSASGFAAAQERGVGALVLLCFLAGVGVSFTPCVLPMVPITMGLIGARGAGSRARAFTLSATYVLGLAAVYTALGVFAGVTGMLFGSWLQSPLIVFSIAGFFVVMGVSMFGFFDVGVPSFLASRLQGKAGGGYGGALGLGVIGAILAGPCSGPVVASILALIGTEGDLPLGATLMFAFSLGMGMIFLVTGAASGWLPSRGAWMVTVKKGFGIVLWLGAIYFSAAHLSPTVTALATSAVLLVTAVFGWPHADDGDGPFTVSLRRLYGIVGGLVGAYLLLGTLVKDGFILPAVSLGSTGGGAAQAQPGIAWIRTEAEALELARSSGKPLMIDFTAEWCAACHEMERFTYTDARVIAAAEGFVPAMLDCTKKGDPVVEAVLKKYGVTGLPTVVFVMPDGRRLGGTVGFVEAAAFVKEMQVALEAKG